jgi:hypothetical protein
LHSLQCTPLTSPARRKWRDRARSAV